MQEWEGKAWQSATQLLCIAPHFVCVGGLSSCDDLLVGSTGFPVRDVVPDRAGEKDGFLSIQANAIKCSHTANTIHHRETSPFKERMTGRRGRYGI